MRIQVFFQDIVAKEIKGKRNITPSFGLDELIKLSIEKAKNAIDSSCNQALRMNCNLIIKDFIKLKSENIQNTLNEKVNKDISEIEIGTNISKTSEILGKSLIYIFLEYLNAKKSINEKSAEIISRFVNDYFSETLKLYQNNLKKIIKEESTKIANDIMDIYIKVNQNNQGYFNIQNQIDKESIYKAEKSYLFNSMKDSAELFCIRNSIRYIWKPINLLIQEYLGKKYEDCIDGNEELKQLFDEYAKKTFDAIDNNLKTLTNF